MKNKLTLSSNRTRKKVHEYLATTHAKNTKLAYQNDIAHFLKSGGIKHWSCVRRVMPRAKILSVSSRIRQIVRNHCMIETESRNIPYGRL